MRKQTFGILLALACARVGTVSAQDTIDCGDASEGVITAARFYAAGEVSDTLNYITDLRNGGDPARFVAWFGSTDSAIIDRVERTVEGIYSGLSEVTYNCNCPEGTSNTVAYVKLSEPGFQIHVCRAYFDDFGMGATVMAVVAHEISHFLGTRDCMKPVSQPCASGDPVPWTPEDARRFAINSPDLASRNAYNIGWFVSNGQ
jgi:hypothetical protein